MNDQSNDIINELIPKCLAGEASMEEETQLFDWIEQSPKNKQHYADFKKLFTLSQKHYAGKANEHININIDSEWNHFIKTIDKADEKPIRRLSVRKNNFNTWYKIAAAILLLVTSGVGINYFASKQVSGHYETADNTLNVTLPDGTSIVLNQQSELFYAADYGEDSRTVTLKGEGFFEVVHDKHKPFIINVNESIIQVVGTSFNVSAYSKYKKVEVVVKTGIVKFTVPSLKKEVTLNAGQKGVYTENGQQLSNALNDDVNFLAWNTRKIVFEENTLRSVIETLNKTYHVNIVAINDIPESCEVTVTFDHQTLEAVLHVLEKTLNLTYQVKGDLIEITSTGC